MPELSTLAHWEFYTVLLSVLLAVAFKQMASRLADDLYEAVKRGLRRLWRWRAPLPVSGPLLAEAPVPAPPAPVPLSQPPAPEAARYLNFEAVANGDICRIYRAQRIQNLPVPEPVIVKLAGELADNPWLQHEANTLHALVGQAGQYARHLPVLRDQFRMDDGRLANVFLPCDGYDLHALRQHFPQGVEPRHVLWILRRTLGVLGYAHSQGILHGNIDPAHIIVRPQDHNIWLVDWCYAVLRPKETGTGFRALNEIYSAPEVAARKAPLPAADLYSLGLTMLYLLGGDPVQQQIPEHVPEPLVRLLRFLLRPSAIQRPQDAWVLFHEVNELREQIYGPHQFLEFKVE